MHPKKLEQYKQDVQKVEELSARIEKNGDLAAKKEIEKLVKETELRAKEIAKETLEDNLRKEFLDMQERYDAALDKINFKNELSSVKQSVDTTTQKNTPGAEKENKEKDIVLEKVEPTKDLPKEKKNFFGRVFDGVKQDRKEKKYGKLALKATGAMAVARAAKKTYDRIKGLFSKEKEGSGDKKPWYKKTRAKILGILGVAAIAKRKGEKVLDRLGGLFSPEDAEKKRDQLGDTLAKKLGSGWSYSKDTNTMHYGGQSWTLEDLQKKGVLIPDANNKDLGYDVSGSVSALQKFIKDPENISSNPQEITRIDKTQSDPEVKKQKTQYENIASIINKHYASKTHKLGDSAIYEKFDDGVVSPGLLIAHLDRTNMYNTNAILNEGVIESFVEGSDKHGERAWLFAAPQEMIVDVLKKLKVPVQALDNFTKAQSIADIHTELARIIKNLDDQTPESVKHYRDEITAKQSMIISYLLDVKETYRQLSGGSEENMKIFNKPLHELITLSQSNPQLKKALFEPTIHEGILEEYQNIESDRSNILTKLEKAETDSQKEKIVDQMFSEIKEVGFVGWSAAFDTLSGHIFEKGAYVDMNILDQVYGETFSERINKIKTLKQKKGKLTPGDMEDFKSLINDFYDTMKAIKTQSHVMQETDNDGDLYTRWHIPVYKAGKKVMQSFLLEKGESGIGLNIIPLTLGTIATVDIATYPIRKPLGMVKGWKKLLSGKEPKIFSPTVGTIREIGAPMIGFVWKHIRLRQLRYTRKLIASKNTAHAMRYLSRIYNTPEKLMSGFEKRHLPLEYAARIAEHNINRTHIKRRKKNPRKRGKTFTADITQNKFQLLRTIYGNQTIGEEKLSVIAKHFDNPKLNKYLRNAVNAEKLLPLLKQGNVKGAINTAKGLSIIDNKEAHKAASDMIESAQKGFAEKQKIINKEWSDTIDKAIKNGKSEKQLKKITTHYEKLLQESTASYNKTIYQQEKTLLKQLKKMKPAERKLLYDNNPIIKNIIDTNGGLRFLNATKRGRMVKIGTYAALALGQGGLAAMDGKSKKEIGREVADFGIGMVPVVGDLYDIGMAIRGKDLNGNDMSTSEIWIRGGLGLVCGVANVFTFGMGGTALKGITKGAIKVGTKMTAKQALKKGISKETLSAFGKQALKNGAITIGGLTVLRGAEQVLLETNLEETSQTSPQLTT